MMVSGHIPAGLPTRLSELIFWTMTLSRGVKCGPEKDLVESRGKVRDDYHGCRFPGTLTIEERLLELLGTG